MKKTLFAIVCTLLFFAACTPLGSQNEIHQLDSVRLFMSMNEDEVEVSTTKFKGALAEDMRDLVAQECLIEEETFVRTIFKGLGANLVVYTGAQSDEVYCVILKPEPEKEIQYFLVQEAPEEGVAATVNGKPILITTVQGALATLPENTPRDDVAVGQVLNVLVSEELLRQKAANMDVSDDEVNASGSIDAAKLTKFLEERLLTNEIEVTNDTLEQFYLENANQFLQSEQAILRQIFISTQERSEEQALALVEQIAGELEQGMSFCGLVTQYSDDTESKNNCGTYRISKGVADPNVEYAGFNTPPNQTAFTTSANGLHLIQTIEVIPAQVVPFGQIESSLKSTVVNSEFQRRLGMYLVLLRANAQINVYLN